MTGWLRRLLHGGYSRPASLSCMDAIDHQRIIEAVDYWVKTKIQQQSAAEASGSAQGGTRSAVTGGRHLAGVNRLILNELDMLGLGNITTLFDRQATVPGFYRASKDWDLLVLSDGEPVLAVEYKSMTGSEGKNLNNRADEVIGAAQDLRQAQEHGLLAPGLKRGYIFLMEVTPAVHRPVKVQARVGTPDPVFNGIGYMDRMAVMLERLRDDGLYDMVWALGVIREPVGFMEPRPTVNWDRFKTDLHRSFAHF